MFRMSANKGMPYVFTRVRQLPEGQFYLKILSQMFSTGSSI